jgi:hypothetical protein
MIKLNLREKKIKIFIIGGIILVILIIAILFARNYWPREKRTLPQSLTPTQQAWPETTQKLMGQIKEGRDLEGLKIGLEEARPDFYETFELVGENVERVKVNYYKVYVRVFNPSAEEKKTFSKIFLKDNLGNEYQPSTKILFDLRGKDFKEFGLDMTIYPRTIREGYIVFPEIVKKAKKLSLVFELESGNQAIFEWGL